MTTLEECIKYPDTKISKYFSFRELSYSYTAQRLGIDNASYLTDVSFANMVTLAIMILDVVRDYYGVPFTPNSGFRCEKLEKVLTWGGDNESSSFARWCRRNRLKVSERSWKRYFVKKSHPTGSAVDYEIPGVDNKDVHDWVTSNIIFDQNILEFHKEKDPKSGWCHTSYARKHNRQSSFTIG